MARPPRDVPKARKPRRSSSFLLLLILCLLVVATACAVFAERVRELRALRAVGPSWFFPSRVYASDFPLTAGQLLSAGQLEAQLRARGYHAARSPLGIPGTYASTNGATEVFLRGFLDGHDPDGFGGPERVRVRFQGLQVVAVDRGSGLAGASPPDLEHPPRLEPVLVALLFDKNRVRRSWVSIERVPMVVQEAVVASEDRRFYQHIGFDLRANARALARDVRAGGLREGASTITQQLARSLFLGNQRTLARKLAEIPLAVGLELLLSKRQILEMYLNGVYWGQAGTVGLGGVAEAARWYFDLPVDSLRLTQAATLAAILPAPNLYDPFAHPDEALEHRNRVLDDLVVAGKISPALAASAKAEPLGVHQGPGPAERYPSYTGYVRDVLDQKLSKDASRGWGLDIFTTMDAVGQPYAEYELSRRVAALGRGLQGAFVALDPRTNAVVAMVGGLGLRTGDFNRATQARRQTGSAIKPIVYAAAFGLGERALTPATVVSDSQRTFGSGKNAWTPRNYDDTYHDQVTLALALCRSLNVATANLVDEIGAGTVASFADRFGLGRFQAVPSIGLGSNETSLLALTNAYAVFANGGTLREPSPIRVVVDGEGKELLRPPKEAESVISPALAALMTGLLQDVVRYGVAYPLRASYGFERPVAGKTGTTNDFNDAWFVGFTPQLVGGVWVGFDRPKSLGRAAAATALPVWAGIMSALLRDAPALAFASDAEVQYVAIDPWSGMLPDSAFCQSMSVPFLPGTAPQIYCSEASRFGEEAYPPDSLYAPDSVSYQSGEPESAQAPPPAENPELYPDSTNPTEDDSMPRIHPRGAGRSGIRR
ncbi:MAG TPA: transglycosylase domain-containing protein [Candidatus Eisenbacteria bacterium]|nr:transglycosylase domain-containing protein [Candidatus Eisenbacteria bacterium]